MQWIKIGVADENTLLLEWDEVSVPQVSTGVCSMPGGACPVSPPAIPPSHLQGRLAIHGLVP